MEVASFFVFFYKKDITDSLTFLSLFLGIKKGTPNKNREEIEK